MIADCCNIYWDGARRKGLSMIKSFLKGVLKIERGGLRGVQAAFAGDLVVFHLFGQGGA